MSHSAFTLVAAACLLGCSAPATPSPVPHDTQPRKPQPPTSFVQRRVNLGHGTATRTTQTLSITGERATLVVVEEEAAGDLTLEQADRATWTTTGTDVLKGSAVREDDRLSLDLQSASTALTVNCWERPLTLGGAGVQRASQLSGDCIGTWRPATTTRVTALACGHGLGLDDGQVEGFDSGTLDETVMRFAPSPGVEFVVESGDGGCFKGLRSLK